MGRDAGAHGEQRGEDQRAPEIVALWKLFEKAGKPGWAAIIPIYNVVVILEMVGKPVWWIVLFIVPIANFVVAFLIAVELAKVKKWIV